MIQRSDPTDAIPETTLVALEAMPEAARAGVHALRRLILRVAAEENTAVREELRWGQPAFLSPKGTTIRIGTHKAARFALFVHCQTSLIDDFRAGPGAAMAFDGTRGVLFNDPDEIDAAALTILIRNALTYRQRRR